MMWFKKKEAFVKQESYVNSDQVMMEMESTIDEYIRRVRKKILFSEDDEFMAKIVLGYCKQFTDRDIKVAHTSQEFEEKIIDDDTALIFSDVNLNAGNGIDIVYRHWKSGHITCPIYFYSGVKLSPDYSDRVAEMNAKFFTKPFDIKDLKKIIKDVMTGEV